MSALPASPAPRLWCGCPTSAVAYDAWGVAICVSCTSPEAAGLVSPRLTPGDRIVYRAVEVEIVEFEPGIAVHFRGPDDARMRCAAWRDWLRGLARRAP